MRYPIPTWSQQFAMEGLMPAVDVTTGTDLLVRPGQRTLIIDWLDQRYQNMLNQIRFWTTDTYVGQKFTTMCYLHQGTTSLWEFDLAFNGLSAPWQLEAGMQIRFPALSEVQRVLALQTATNRVGRTVTL